MSRDFLIQQFYFTANDPGIMKVHVVGSLQVFLWLQYRNADVFQKPQKNIISQPANTRLQSVYQQPPTQLHNSPLSEKKETPPPPTTTTHPHSSPPASSSSLSHTDPADPQGSNSTHFPSSARSPASRNRCSGMRVLCLRSGDRGAVSRTVAREGEIAGLRGEQTLVGELGYVCVVCVYV